VVRWIGDDCAVLRAGGYAAVSNTSSTRLVVTIG